MSSEKLNSNITLDVFKFRKVTNREGKSPKLPKSRVTSITQHVTGYKGSITSYTK